MWSRVLALTSARLRATGWDLAGPLGSLLLPGSLALLFAALISSELSTFPYALFALGLSAALVSVPLLGEFSSLMREDPTGDWIQAQPVRAGELALSRLLTIGACVSALAVTTILPFVLLAPEDCSLPARLSLLGAGVGQAFFVTAALALLQRLLTGRAEGLLVLLQAALVVGGIIGGLVSLEALPALAHVTEIAELPRAWQLAPPALLASAVSVGSAGAWAIPGAATLVAMAILAFLPPIPRAASSSAGARGGPLGFILAPLRRLAARVWVKREERGAFEFVFDALPLEQDFVLRSYPLIGIPLAFLFLGLRSRTGDDRESMLALALFTTATYLPVLFAHVPVTRHPGARWLLETSPCPPAAIFAGAYKAVVLRFVVPLYATLAIISALVVGPASVLRLAFPAFAVAVLVSRVTFPIIVRQLPLSITPEEIVSRDEVMKIMMGLGFSLAILSAIARAKIPSPTIGLALGLVVLAFAMFDGKRQRTDG